MKNEFLYNLNLPLKIIAMRKASTINVTTANKRVRLRRKYSVEAIIESSLELLTARVVSQLNCMPLDGHMAICTLNGYVLSERRLRV